MTGAQKDTLYAIAGKETRNIGVTNAQSVLKMVFGEEFPDEDNSESERLAAPNSGLQNTSELLKPKDDAILNVAPNPFNRETIVSYYLTNNGGTDVLKIIDMKGTVKNVVPLSIGHGTLRINGSGMNDGLYLFAIFSDGKITGSRKVIFNK